MSGYITFEASIVKRNAILVCLIYIFEYINYNYERVLHFVLQKIINANALILFGKRKNNLIKSKNNKHIYKITVFCYNEISFSELFYGYGDDTMATLKKQRRIDTDNRIKDEWFLSLVRK